MAFRFTAAVCLILAASAQKADVPAATEASKKFLQKDTMLATKGYLPYKNNYIPGVNGVVFDTPPPGDDRSQSYQDTGKGAVILGFFFIGVVILITWMECK